MPTRSLFDSADLYPGESHDRAAYQREIGATLPSVVGVVDLLARARAAGLQYPKLWLALPDGTPLRITVAGERSRTPGYLVLTDDGRYPNNLYFGRISPAGVLEFGRDAGTRRDALIELLTRLAFNPAKVAADYGHMTGNCCFCSLKLKDARSIAVGYGRTCAQKFSLPWGHAEPRPDFELTI
jgi:hypothetical protein